MLHEIQNSHNFSQIKTTNTTYRKSRCISRVFETTNRAKFKTSTYTQSPNQYEVSLTTQDVVLDFSVLIHRDLRYKSFFVC